MMSAQRGGGKKRKQADSGDAERNLYGSFVHAANAVSQLYTAGLQAAKKAEEAGARRALERVAQFVVKEYGNAPSVPTAVLMEVLRQELQAAQGSAAAIQLPFPVPLLPTGDSQGSDAHSDDEHLMSAGEPSPGTAFRRTPSGHTISPPKGARPAPSQLPALFQQQQAQQMQAAAAAHQAQQQAQAAAQQAAMHQHLLAQMQQQQQQQQQQQGGFMPGGFPGQPFQ
jgi:hypothetical protein